MACLSVDQGCGSAFSEASVGVRFVVVVASPSEEVPTYVSGSRRSQYCCQSSLKLKMV